MQDDIIQATNAKRLDDFKKVLTYQLIRKIKYHFGSDVAKFYSVPSYWTQFRAKTLTDKTINPWQLIAKFNDAGLTRQQVKSIFGKYPNAKTFTIPYSDLIDKDPDITIRNHGTLVTGKEDNKRRIGFAICYLLPQKYIQSIFDDPKLLAKVSDASSDFYSDRQRRLIFTQINKSKKTHYKTNTEIKQEQDIEAIVSSFDFAE